MSIVRTGIAALLVSLALAGCSGGFGGPKRSEPEAASADPNAYPAHYRNQITALLTTELADRADFHGALIAPPAIKPVGDSQHYLVCLQFSGHNQRKEKVVIFLSGVPIQFVDSKPEQCSGAAYQPFTELESAAPETSNTSTPYDFSYKQ